MKYLTILFFSFALLSCTKTYQCECVSSPPSGNVSSNTSTVKTTQNDAVKYCKEQEAQYLYTTCTIK